MNKMENENPQSSLKYLVIVINYSNEAEVIEYARMLSLQSESDYIQLVIVINKRSNDAKANFEEHLKGIDLRIKLVDPQENLGYLNGVLYGYRMFTKEDGKSPEWVIVSNTDIEIDDDCFFEKFGQTHYNDDVWCIGPSIYSPNKKSYDNPHYVERVKLEKINRLIWIYEHPYLTYIYHKLAAFKSISKRKLKKESQYVYSNHGCFFFLNSQFVELIKDLHYEPFLYSEESLIAELINENKKKSYYDSNLEVIHTENSVTGLLGVKKKSQYVVNSLKYIRDKFY